MKKNLYFYLLLLITVFLLNKEKMCSRNQKRKESDNKKPTSGQYRTKVKKYFRVEKDTPDPIKAEDITIKIGNDQTEDKASKESMAERKKENSHRSSRPNETALSILWSYYQACKQGLLKSNSPTPWDLVHNGKLSSKRRSRNQRFSMRKDKKWHLFLENLVSDKNWTEWINDPEEAKEKALKAYNNVQKGRVYSKAASQ